eukprot:1340243-Pyramimonas_sp.AAC.1
MATPATVDVMMRVAMIVTLVAMTTAKPMTAPMLTTSADHDDDVFASAMKVWGSVRHARAADAREGSAWYYFTATPQHARKGVRMSSTCGARSLFGRLR